MKLSVVIPSYKDPLLTKTIESLLDNSELGDQLEVVAVLDGYEPEFNLIIDPRVRYIRQKNTGMRGAINRGVREAKGEFIMRTDEHCSFAKGYDKELTDSCQPDWIMTPRRYYLDPVKWEVMDIPPCDFCKLIIAGGRQKFAAVNWHSRNKELKDTMIAETMGMQGSCWIMPKKWWEEVIVSLDTDNYGPLYQDSVEMIFKTWNAGGKMMLNKNTWHAHKHIQFKRTHNDGSPEHPSEKEKCFKYALDTWGKYYKEVIRPRFGV